MASSSRSNLALSDKEKFLS
jgi:hypothetical protein